MSRSSRHIAAAGWLTLFAMTGAPALADPPPKDATAAQSTAGVTPEQAGALQGQGRWDEAAEAWRAVAEANPDSGRAWFNLAYCLHAGGHLEEAIEMHKKAATFDDYHGIAMYNLGCAYALVGRPDDAIDALAEAQDAGFSLRDRVGSDPDLESLLGTPELAALLQREPAGFREKAMQLMAGVKQWFSGPQFTGMMQKLSGAAQAALAKLQENERFAGMTQRLQAWLGGRGDAETRADARKDADRETHDEAGPPEHGGSTVTLEQARGYQQVGDWNKAVEAYRALLVEQPDSHEAWFGLAYSLHMSGDYEQAIKAHKESAKFDQTRSIALYNLACAYSLTGRIDEAVETLEESRRAGFDITAARSDSDFDPIRDDPRFKKVFRTE